MPQQEVIDIRDGEMFRYTGQLIKQAVDSKMQSNLRPAYEKALTNIANLVRTEETKGEVYDTHSSQVAGLLVALAGDPNDWSAKASEIQRNADIAHELDREMMEIARISQGLDSAVVYIIDSYQLLRFGLGTA